MQEPRVAIWIGALVVALLVALAPTSSARAHADGIADHDVRAALWLAKLVIYVALFVGLGGAFFRAWIGDPSSGAASAWLGAIMVAGLFALVMSVGLQGL